MMHIQPPNEEIKPFVHPTIAEILAQQRIMLGHLTELLRLTAQPMWFIEPKEKKE